MQPCAGRPGSPSVENPPHSPPAPHRQGGSTSARRPAPPGVMSHPTVSSRTTASLPDGNEDAVLSSLSAKQRPCHCQRLTAKTLETAAPAAGWDPSPQSLQALERVPKYHPPLRRPPAGSVCNRGTGRAAFGQSYLSCFDLRCCHLRRSAYRSCQHPGRPRRCLRGYSAPLFQITRMVQVVVRHGQRTPNYCFPKMTACMAPGGWALESSLPRCFTDGGSGAALRAKCMEPQRLISPPTSVRILRSRSSDVNRCLRAQQPRPRPALPPQATPLHPFHPSPGHTVPPSEEYLLRGYDLPQIPQLC